MAEIAREVGRSPSTLHQWAAAGGWRIVELEAEGFAPPKRDCAPAACPACPDKARSEGPDGPEHQEEMAAPLSPLDAAKALHQKSADLASAGQVRAAEAAARLADRILRTEFHLSRIAGPTDASQEEKDAQEDAGMNDARAELWDRFNKIRKAKGLSVDPHPWR